MVGDDLDSIADVESLLAGREYNHPVFLTKPRDGSARVSNDVPVAWVARARVECERSRPCVHDCAIRRWAADNRGDHPCGAPLGSNSAVPKRIVVVKNVRTGPHFGDALDPRCEPRGRS